MKRFFTIDKRGFDLVSRDEQGRIWFRRKTYCNPNALRQIILDTEMRGPIDWNKSQVAKPE